MQLYKYHLTHCQMRENLQIFNLNWGQKMNLNRIILPVMFLSALSNNSFAQSIPATGGLLIDDETYESIDTRPRNRSEILIKKADLSSMFPDPGFQGAQGSCTGWAVSYAARSYYNASSLGKKPSSPSGEKWLPALLPLTVFPPGLR